MDASSKKKLQKYRTMSYFIEAGIEIIEEEGLSSLSIRKAADKAGYNSATLYHYFSGLDELAYFSCMKFVDEYAKNLPDYLSQARSPIEKYLKVWECFCVHSFHHPDVFRFLFFQYPEHKGHFSHYLEEFYRIFPKNWSDEIQDYQKMLTSERLYDREYIALTKSLEKEKIQISQAEISQINSMNILLYRGMLDTMSDCDADLTPEQAAKETIQYMSRTLSAFHVIS